MHRASRGGKVAPSAGFLVCVGVVLLLSAHYVPEKPFCALDQATLPQLLPPQLLKWALPTPGCPSIATLYPQLQALLCLPSSSP